MTLNADGSVLIGGKTYSSIALAQGRFRYVRGLVRSPFKFAVCVLVLLELRVLARLA